MGIFNLEKIFHDELTGKIFVVMIFLVFIAISFVIFFHLYAKWYLFRSPAIETTPQHRPISISTVGRGLDSRVLKTIPIMSFVSEEHKMGIECAVCLSEVSEGEKFRLLPKCHHGFHVDCIDMWFESHVTCPLCRDPIPAQNTVGAENNLLPVSVLLGGNVDEENTNVTGLLSSYSSSGTVVIDIPRQVVAEDEERAEVTTTRLRSLRSLLGYDSRVNACSSIGHGTGL